ncbi:DUF2180 family protein [Vogesella indigofera]
MKCYRCAERGSDDDSSVLCIVPILLRPGPGHGKAA